MLDLPEVDVAMNLPKQFALANVAIRLQHRMADPITKSKNSYMAIVGIDYRNYFALYKILETRCCFMLTNVRVTFYVIQYVMMEP